MHGRDFLIVAEELAREPTEAHWRTAVGRAYYAAMLEVRDAMTSWGLSQPPHTSVHNIVRRRAFVSSDSDMKQIAISLDQLRKNRNRADYELQLLPEFASAAGANSAISLATRAVSFLDAIDQDQTRSSSVFAEIKRVLP